MLRVAKPLRLQANRPSLRSPEVWRNRGRDRRALYECPRGTQLAALGDVASKNALSESSFAHPVLTLREEINRLTEEQLLPILLIMFSFWIVCAVEWVQRFAGIVPDPRFWTLLSLIVTVYGGLQVFRLRGRWWRGQDATGEKKIALILNGIRSKGFVAFHNLPGENRNIDHVVIGPSGVYAIETKARSGSGTISYRNDDELVFAGRIRDGGPLQHARDSARTLQVRLNEQFQETYLVKPLVVFLGDWSIDRGQGEFAVDVTTADQLPEYFAEQAPALTGGEIARISAHFENASLN